MNDIAKKPYCQPQHKVLNMLLYPEDRLVKKNILSWTIELTALAKKLQQDFSYEKTAVLLNLSSLLYCMVGKLDTAEFLCRHQIQYFIKKSKNELTLLRFIIQPWINLGRLDRLRKNSSASLKKFNVLKNLIEKESRDNAIIFQSSLLSAIGCDENLVKVMKTCSYLEPLKTYLMNDDRRNTINISSKIIKEASDNLLVYASYEALFITYARSSNLKKAFYYLQCALNSLSPQFMHIFLFRKAEFLAICNHPKAIGTFQKLVELIYYFEKNAIDNNKIFYSIKLAHQLLNFNYRDLASKAYARSLRYAKKMGDEVLTIECMANLVELGESDLKNELVDLVNNSHYLIVKNKFKPIISNDNKSILEENLKNLFNQIMSITKVEKC